MIVLSLRIVLWQVISSDRDLFSSAVTQLNKTCIVDGIRTLGKLVGEKRLLITNVDERLTDASLGIFVVSMILDERLHDFLWLGQQDGKLFLATVNKFARRMPHRFKIAVDQRRGGLRPSILGSFYTS